MHNQRNFFRIGIRNVPCYFKLLSINGKPVGISKEGKGEICNISAGGMLLETTLDFPIKLEIVLRISFKIGQQWFCFEGKIVRKEDGIEVYRYGIKFINLIEQEREHFLSLLSKLQLKSSDL